MLDFLNVRLTGIDVLKSLHMSDMCLKHTRTLPCGQAQVLTMRLMVMIWVGVATWAR